MTEQQRYTVVSEHDGYEVRRYPAHLLAQVEAPGSFFEAGNRGFGPLIRYITASHISMTAPVIQAPGVTQQWTVSFVMPAGATRVPAPSDAAVRIVEVRSRRRLPGMASPSKVRSASHATTRPGSPGS